MNDLSSDALLLKYWKKIEIFGAMGGRIEGGVGGDRGFFWLNKMDLQVNINEIVVLIRE